MALQVTLLPDTAHNHFSLESQRGSQVVFQNFKVPKSMTYEQCAALLAAIEGEDNVVAAHVELARDTEASVVTDALASDKIYKSFVRANCKINNASSFVTLANEGPEPGYWLPGFLGIADSGLMNTFVGSGVDLSFLDGQVTTANEKQTNS